MTLSGVGARVSSRPAWLRVVLSTILILTLALAVQGGASGARIALRADQTSLPSPSVVIPITIQTQAENRTGSYQQPIQFNPSLYSAYLDANLGNMLFVYSNGTPIYAWIQSNATSASGDTVVWLNLSGLSDRTVYAVLFPKTVTFLARSGYLGEAPELSPVYGEYDNGGMVFPFFDDFTGSRLNSSDWVQQGSAANYTVDDGLTLGNNQWGGILSRTTFDASDQSIGLDLNYSASIYLNVAVGTDGHVRLLGGADGMYYIGDAFGLSNGTFSNTSGFGFFSFWTSPTVGNISYGAQSLNIVYGHDFGPTSGEQISIRSDSAGWIYVRYALLRQLPVTDSEYVPTVVVSRMAVSPGREGLYPVQFRESGLPSGTPWSLNVFHVASFSLNSSGGIALVLANGNYSCSGTSTYEDFTTVPTTFRVAGVNQSITLEFLHQYPIDFRESGLPTGWLWGVNLSGRGVFVTYAATLQLLEVNGTYNYSVITPDPTSSSNGGRVTVSGAPAVVNVVFETSPTPLIPILVPYFIEVGGVGTVVIILVVRRIKTR